MDNNETALRLTKAYALTHAERREVIDDLMIRLSDLAQFYRFSTWQRVFPHRSMWTDPQPQALAHELRIAGDTLASLRALETKEIEKAAARDGAL